MKFLLNFWRKATNASSRWTVDFVSVPDNKVDFVISLSKPGCLWRSSYHARWDHSKIAQTSCAWTSITLSAAAADLSEDQSLVLLLSIAYTINFGSIATYGTGIQDPGHLLFNLFRLSAGLGHSLELMDILPKKKIYNEDQDIIVVGTFWYTLDLIHNTDRISVCNFWDTFQAVRIREALREIRKGWSTPSLSLIVSPKTL